MERGRPPELGDLLQVIPVVQSQQRGVWTVTLASIEQWDTCFVATFDIVRDELVDYGAQEHPALEVEAVDQDGMLYRSSLRGGYGGGLVSGGIFAREVRKFAPPLPAETASVRISAKLQLTGQGRDFPPREVVVWEEPNPWIFEVDLSDRPSLISSSERTQRGQAPHAAPGATGMMPSLMRLQWVIPVARERESAGWRITAIAAELYEDGFQLSFRLIGPGKPEGLLQPLVQITDDRGRTYRCWPGAGIGQPSIKRIYAIGAPAPAATSRELRVAIDELQILGFEPSPTDPMQGEEVVCGAIPGDWSFVVDLA